MRFHDDKWIDHFRAEGYAEAAPLSSGMEGAVYRLGGGLVAKVWGDKSATSLGGLEQFYADLARASLPFATPEIVAVNKVGSTAITIERELPGRPLREFLSPSDSSAPTQRRRVS